MTIKKPIINILTYILDDDIDYINLIDKAFKDNNQVDYTIYSDVDEFINAIDEEKKICIIDYNLKNKLNGLDIMKIILAKNPHCYVIMVSNQQEIEVVTEFYDNDGYRYIKKSNEGLSQKLISTVKKAKDTIQRHLDHHFEIIEKFNKTEEIFKDARNTINNTLGGNS